MSQPNSEHKFHPIYGKFLKVAFEASFDVETKLADIRVPDVDLTSEQEEELKHRGLSFLNVYHQAEVCGDALDSSLVKIVAAPWVTDDKADHCSLLFRSKALGPNFPVFARFEDKPCFRGNRAGGNCFTSLDYFSLTKDSGFNPVFAKIKDREVVVYLKIVSEELGELQITRVTPDQVPSKLLSA